ncbi:MAG: hypothetical protein Q9205_004688 [Flavoplaca limonia]
MDYSNNPRLSQIPAARPPPGTLSNLVDPPTLEIPTITVNAILLSLALGVVALRVYTKHSLLRNLGWDDFTCILALVGSAAHSGLIIYDVEHSFLGRHLWDIPIVKIDATVARNNTALSLVYSPAVFLMKLSVLLLQKQLFGVNQIIRYLIYFGIAFQAVWAIVSIAVYSVAAAECTGIEALTNMDRSFKSHETGSNYHQLLRNERRPHLRMYASHASIFQDTQVGAASIARALFEQQAALKKLIIDSASQEQVLPRH